MKRTKRLFKRLSMAGIIPLLALSSCLAGEKEIQPPVVTGDEADVTFSITLPGKSAPATRAMTEEQENEITAMDVLVFEPDGDYVYTARCSGDDISTTTGTNSRKKTFTVKLRQGTFDLVLLANSRSLTNQDFSGKNKTEVLEMIQPSVSGKWLADGTSPIPMWGEKDAVVIDEQTDLTGTNAIKLTRMVARVDVSIANMAQNSFKLTSVHVYNYNTKGSIAPLASQWDATTEPDAPIATAPNVPTSSELTKGPIVYNGSSVVDGEDCKSEIYIFEAENHATLHSAAKGLTSRTCIVIGGKYSSDGGTTWSADDTHFYRMDFSTGTGASQTYLDVLRNHWYTFSVTNVSGPGYESAEIAFNSEPENIEVNVIPWNEGQIGDIMIEGPYLLAVRPGSEFEFSKPAGTQTASIKATHPEGWKITEITELNGATEQPVTDAWLTIDKTIDTYYGDDGEFAPLKILVTENSGAARTGYIYIQAGKLLARLTVTQSNVIPLGIEITDLSGNALSSLNFAADNGGNAPAAQSFKVTWTPADRPVTISRTKTGADAFTWQDASSGFSQLSIAAGTYTFNVNPTAIPAESSPFYNRGSKLTFTITDASGQSASKSITLTQGNEVTGVSSVFNVIPPATNITYSGGSKTITVTSTATATVDGSPVSGDVAWIAEFSENDGPWTTTAPAWFTGFPTSGLGGASIVYNAVVQAFPATAGINDEDDLLRKAQVKGTAASPYNLSTKGAAGKPQNTANCYVINAAGHYKLPLVYGNAIKNGTTNTPSFNPGGSSTNRLATFKNHLGGAGALGDITDPYLYNNTGVEPHDAVMIWMDWPGLISNVDLDENKEYLTFEVPKATIAQGNAVLAVRDSEGKILWSWHIWVTPTTIFDVDDVAGSTIAITANKVGENGATKGDGLTRNVMKYNLGWCTARTNSVSYGSADRTIKIRISQTGIDNPATPITVSITQTKSAPIGTTKGNSPYWQFGRKDPLPPSSGVTGSTASKPTMVYGANYNYANGGKVALGTAIQNPHTYYYASTSPYDWCSTQYNNLWTANNTADQDPGTVDVVKTVYDPSPVGYQMPHIYTWTGFTQDGENKSSSARAQFNVVENAATAFTAGANGVPGWTFYTGGWQAGVTTFFPAAGLRYTTGGTLGNVGSYGYYWSAGPGSASYGYSLYFNSGNVYPTISNDRYRYYGFSVRAASELYEKHEKHV